MADYPVFLVDAVADLIYTRAVIEDNKIINSEQLAEFILTGISNQYLISVKPQEIKSNG
jgi:hypothetical protein